MRERFLTKSIAGKEDCVYVVKEKPSKVDTNTIIARCMDNSWKLFEYVGGTILKKTTLPTAYTLLEGDLVVFASSDPHLKNAGISSLNYKFIQDYKKAPEDNREVFYSNTVRQCHRFKYVNEREKLIKLAGGYSEKEVIELMLRFSVDYGLPKDTVDDFVLDNL